jgi:hypothetical protein
MNERWSFYAPRKVTYVSGSSPSESVPIVSIEPILIMFAIRPS